MNDLPHIRFYHSETDSPSWRALGATAIALLVELRFLLLQEAGTDSVVSLTVREAQRRLGNVGQAKVEKAFAALIEHGWIEKVPTVSGCSSQYLVINHEPELRGEPDAEPTTRRRK
ncbi:MULTISPECIES: hypothetical protein [Xanthomonas]|uniref:Helix-turn-helix domain-containing protein n=2 Tax=Xanthomonas TaxID=338 RepID=A0A7Z7NG45_XANCH|nr:MULTISPECIES: hypothetical protein [Xanthomonas]ATS39468.1 hypothetical protein XcfCFBP6988P_16160 [Xanthomonas citri pv. phaseoli var. fuscans]ATS41725.1 hypothetical protein XcfCFBP6989P_04335 [Xanthomonas citri pv. phaseoli var. fuscans]ATS47471.1 hypothetical protein XcfCFBP6990P_13030 [Xanthomonas citri pv. phaseoli var. fuscans]ATS86150.1 hypothetical protein XcfCFBP6991P_21205 [Xanthomonas citri pv. phaseoli var. fuscans]QWN21104.1 hypothetical protein DGM98_14080 [Xanthomonas citri]